jgi:hypothetical protein
MARQAQALRDTAYAENLESPQQAALRQWVNTLLGVRAASGHNLQLKEYTPTEGQYKGQRRMGWFDPLSGDFIKDHGPYNEREATFGVATQANLARELVADEFYNKVRENLQRTGKLNSNVEATLASIRDQFGNVDLTKLYRWMSPEQRDEAAKLYNQYMRAGDPVTMTGLFSQRMALPTTSPNLPTGTKPGDIIRAIGPDGKEHRYRINDDLTADKIEE